MKIRLLRDKMKNSGKMIQQTIFLICLIGFVMISFPQNGIAEKKPLESEKISLTEALYRISVEYHVFFSYDQEAVQDIEVNYEPERYENVEHALDRMLKGTSLHYKIFNNRYIILYESSPEALSSLRGMVEHLETVIDKEEKSPFYRSSSPLAKLPARSAVFSVRPIAFSVSGTITDDAGEPLIGVNIQVKGYNTGTSTDFDGRFSLEDIDENAVLVISYVGYQTQEIPVAGKSNLEIIMISDSQLLDEVVVVGYGTQRKSEITGAVSVIQGSELDKQPGFNVMQKMKGKIPGLTISTNSGSPTGSNRVVIRGQGTINSSMSPLYVVDGVPMDNMNFVNPNDISSIEVLKDASAAAIYGARGANGVILVTTKRGGNNIGAIDLEYSGGFEVGKLANPVHLLNSEEFMKVQRISFENAPIFNDYPEGQLPVMDLSDSKIFDSDGNPIYDTDWQKEATRTSLSHNHQLSIRTKGASSSFGVFMNYARKEGIFLNSWASRGSLKIVYDVELFKFLKIGTNVLLSKSGENAITETGGGAHASRVIAEMPPIFPVKWSDGSWSNSTEILGFVFEGMPNPVHRLMTEERLNYYSQIFGNTFIEIRLSPKLSLRSQIGLDNLLHNQDYYAPTDLIGAGFPDGNAIISNNENLYWQNENFLSFRDQFGSHRINGVLGAAWQEKVTKGSTLRATEFISDFYKYNNIGVATNQPPSTSFNSDWTMNSFFIRGTYNYKDKYSITATGRADGSSRFGENNKYGFFPSAGFSWMLTNEKFASDIKNIDIIRLRASYGVVGNSEIGNYNSLATISSGTTLIGGRRVPRSVPTRIGNNDLSWEKTRQFNIGAEFNLFNNRIYIELDYYDKFTDDLILARPIPSTTGFNTIIDNIGSVSNKGVDFLLTTRNLINPDKLNWETTLNFNHNRNKIVQLGLLDEDIFPGPDWVSGSQTILRVGEPIGSFWGYERLGIYGISEAEEAQKAGFFVGEAKRSENKKIIGNSQPKLTGNLINTFYWKNFNFIFDLQFLYGAEIMHQTLATAEDRMALTSGYKSQLYDSWTESNQNTMVQRIRNTNLSGQNLQPDSHWIVDGSFLRGNLVSLGFNPNLNLLNNKIQSLNVNLNCENAFLIKSKDFLGYDPEASTWHDNFGQNIFFYEYPKARVYSVSFRINF